MAEDTYEDAKRLLAAARIDAPDGDLASLARVLGVARRRVERMYEVETGDEVPAAVFRADQGAGS